MRVVYKPISFPLAPRACACVFNLMHRCVEVCVWINYLGDGLKARVKYLSIVVGGHGIQTYAEKTPYSVLWSTELVGNTTPHGK